MTAILKPGPISRGRFEKSARRATAFELIDERSELKRVKPSLADDGAFSVARGAGAKRSSGAVLYMMSYAHQYDQTMIHG